jgi:Protein of unknown function, DUF547
MRTTTTAYVLNTELAVGQGLGAGGAGSKEHHERLALFLNLYHVMILHAYMVLGPPTSALRWASYFTTLCYEVGGEIFRLVA